MDSVIKPKEHSFVLEPIQNCNDCRNDCLFAGTKNSISCTKFSTTGKKEENKKR
jgi:hypothetical protein